MNTTALWTWEWLLAIPSSVENHAGTNLEYPGVILIYVQARASRTVLAESGQRGSSWISHDPGCREGQFSDVSIPSPSGVLPRGPGPIRVR